MAVMRAAFLLVGVAAVAGCSFDPSGLGPNGGSGVADASTIDTAIAIDTPPGTPDGMPDMGACSPMCAGDTLMTCDGTGPVTCDLGCLVQGAPHCAALVPSNGATETDDLPAGASASLIVPANTVFILDTDTGAIASAPSSDLTNFTPVRGAGQGVVDGISFRIAGGIAIFGVEAVSVASTGYVRPFNNHPSVWLARRNVTINGTVDVSGGCVQVNGTLIRNCPGPGGGSGGDVGLVGTGCAPGGGSVHTSVGTDSGGGGGGFGKDGGDGGDGDGAHKGGGGGKSNGCTGATLEPLVGGGGGGGGGSTGGANAVGGGGGGALQITSLGGDITIATTGNSAATLDAGGRGGGNTGGAGGAGGGAGGGLLLEARKITLTSADLTANGGGGGAGRNGSSFGPGAKGSTTSATPAPGGAADLGGKGGGGAGGAGNINAVNGDGPVDGGGGGGGAVGRIRFNVRSSALTSSGGVISPAQTRGDPTVK
jgi:hypothetical protein